VRREAAEHFQLARAQVAVEEVVRLRVGQELLHRRRAAQRGQLGRGVGRDPRAEHVEGAELRD
jgi:hypothetical protein